MLECMRCREKGWRHKISPHYYEVLAKHWTEGVAGAASGNLRPVRLAFDHFTFECRHLHEENCAPLGPLGLSGCKESLQEFYAAFRVEVAVSAARSSIAGSPILKWLLQQGAHRFQFHSMPELCQAAASSGSLESLLFLRPLVEPCSWDLASCARAICSSTAWQALQKDLQSVGAYAHASAGIWALAAQLQDIAIMGQLKAAGQLYPCDLEACQVLLGNGNVETILWLLHSHGTCQDVTSSDLFTQWVHAALSQCNAAVLQWLRSISPAAFWQQSGLYSKAKSTHIRELLRSPEFCCPCTPRDFEKAAQRTDLEELQLLAGTRMPCDQPWDKRVCEAAALQGHMATIQWLWDRVPSSFWDEACMHALNGHHAHVIRWLLHQTPPPPFVPRRPLGGWLLRGSAGPYPCDPTDNCIGWTVLGYHSQLPSQGLLEQIPVDPYACRQAAAINHMELMVYLRKKGYPWDARSCNLAAANGHLRMLRWLRGQTLPCPWDAHTTQLAAENDRLDVLSWLLSQAPACPFPHRPEKASDRCMQHLIVMRCPMPTPSSRARAEAVCPLPASLVLGLTRWHGTLGAQAAAPFRLAARARGDDLLAHLSRLPTELVRHICNLAGLCRPVQPNKNILKLSLDSSDRRSSGSLMHCDCNKAIIAADTGTGLGSQLKGAGS